MTLYCNQCGFGIQYTAIKPASCPKCSTVFAKLGTIPQPIPTKPVYPKVAAVAIAAEEDDDPEPPRRSQERRPGRPARAKTHRVMDADSGETLASAPTEPEDDFSDNTYDRRAARRLAKELIATIDPASIRVIDEDRSTKVRFGDWVKIEGGPS